MRTNNLAVAVLLNKFFGEIIEGLIVQADEVQLSRCHEACRKRVAGPIRHHADPPNGKVARRCLSETADR